MKLPKDSFEINRRKLLNAFPKDIKSDVKIVIDYLSDKNFDIHPTAQQEVILNGEHLIIPSRIYFDKPTDFNSDNLTKQQKKILNCIYLRHHNGFVRQRQLKELKDNTEYYVIPFIFQLLGEYVIEILYDIDEHLNERTINNYVKFIRENERYWQQTESRMISYWNEYYRYPNFKRLNDYIGKRIFDKISQNLA